MTFLQAFYLYLMTIPAFFIIDMIWLGTLATKFYQSQIGFLLGPVNWVAAIVFYLIYIVGIIIFAVNPALEAGSLGKAIMLGALFGFFAYATYDFTNLATIKDWPVLVTVVDIIWGTILTSSVAGVSYYLGKTFIL
ncbi:DUF2177 family protein [Candidatus Nomurabacteria bacterium]|nr:DUF2177 family protein [Candidatus Kaiserbacteria bacterium]MCB9810104.1 DUF2177 family protein [Candidatus Nomurabacteria bacterium]MCB9818501.1 DUF2177 family protein [Candidatus Nomurabacteria bacterium]